MPTRNLMDMSQSAARGMSNPAAEPKKRGKIKRTIDFYRLECNYASDCCILVLSNFVPDLLTNFGIVRYPFLGIWEVLQTTKYGYSIVLVFLSYIVAYIAMLLIYFLFLLPFTVAAYGFFGPIGFLLAILHGILFSNIVACHEIRTDAEHYILNLLKCTFAKHRMSAVLLCPDTLHLRPEDQNVPWGKYLKSIEFWAGALPTFLLQQLVTSMFFFVWYLISLIPFVGIILLKFHTSPRRGFSYVLPFYRDVKQYDKRALTRIYYGGYAKWLLLGASTGLSELVPILAGLTLCTNAAGCARWEIELVKASQAQE